MSRLLSSLQREEKEGRLKNGTFTGIHSELLFLVIENFSSGKAKALSPHPPEKKSLSLSFFLRQNDEKSAAANIKFRKVFFSSGE